MLTLPLSLLLLLQTSLASPVPASPASGPCAGLYDCTSTENSLLTHFARLPDISACRARCREDARCQHFTFNYKLESLYPGACFLLTSCSLRRPGASQWVSEARDCAVLPAPPTLPRHYRDLVVLVRTQWSQSSQPAQSRNLSWQLDWRWKVMNLKSLQPLQEFLTRPPNSSRPMGQPVPESCIQC